MKNGFHAIRAYSIALLTLAAGIGLSIYLSDWQWFARTGSLVVINGIFLTSKQIIEHMQQLGRYQSRGSTPCDRDWASSDRHEFVHDSHELRWLSEKCGLYLLFLGTLVWGFGDLLGRVV
ncbi:MAG: hypothetical protein ACQETD_05460 [Pseudomonadota bacterium]